MTKSRAMLAKEAVVQRDSIEKGVAKYTGKHLWHRFFFNKVAGLMPATLSKKRLWHRCFPVNCAKFLRALFYRTQLVGAFVTSFISKAGVSKKQNFSSAI